MKTKYEKLTLKHKLLGVILPNKRSEHIYSNRTYLIPPVTRLHDDTINKNVKRTEVHQAKGKHKANQNDLAI